MRYRDGVSSVKKHLFESYPEKNAIVRTFDISVVFDVSIRIPPSLLSAIARFYISTPYSGMGSVLANSSGKTLLVPLQNSTQPSACALRLLMQRLVHLGQGGDRCCIWQCPAAAGAHLLIHWLLVRHLMHCLPQHLQRDRWQHLSLSPPFPTPAREEFVGR